MRKNIDIDQVALTKLKVLSAFEGLSVKALMEKAVKYKESKRLENMTDEEKEDLGLLLLMQQVDIKNVASRDEIMGFLEN